MLLKKLSYKAASYSPVFHCSTIGVSGLNFSVRDGKRCDTATIATILFVTSAKVDNYFESHK